jgi:hypothetical protein
MPKSTNPLIGKRFRHVLADCSVLLEVKRPSGRGVLECVVVNVPVEIDGKTFDSEFAGTVHYLSKAVIETRIAYEEQQAVQQRKSDQWWDSQVEGSVLHYHSFTNQFVRCVVTVLTEETQVGMMKYPAGTKVLRQAALVGDWSERDLCLTSLSVRYIRERHLMRPHISNLFESPLWRSPCRFNPNDLPALDFVGQQELFA